MASIYSYIYSIASPMTFETSYTGFRSGSESRSNFVCLFSAACAVKPLHTSRRCSLLYQTVMRCDRIVRQLVVISSYREHSPKLSALVGLRSLDRLHGTRSQHPWKTKICLPQSSDLNSRLTCLIPRTFVFVYICFARVLFWLLAARHSRNGYWSVRERLQMIFRIVSYIAICYY